ncbi:hypothetical protein Hanom_Chr15g01377811 [Helianthus anomalus]
MCAGQQDHWLQVQPRLIELVCGKQEVVGYGAFLATSLYMPSHAKGLLRVYAYRNLLQV